MAAAQLGLKLAADLEATVHLLSVIDSGRDRVLSTLSGADIDADERREGASDTLETLATDARYLGIDVFTETSTGRPADEIVDYAESASIDLIAMGTVGRGGFERYLLGSVTDSIVRTATVPVLTVRPNEGEWSQSAHRGIPNPIAYQCLDRTIER